MIPPARLTGVAPEIVRFVRLLADETRLAMVRLLAYSDLRAGELGAALHLPSNVVSYHLKQLQALGLVRHRRSSADARDVYHHVDLPRLHSLFAATGGALFPGLAAAMAAELSDQALAQTQVRARDAEVLDATTTVRPLRPLRVLFLCTHNSARSQLAEALLRSLGGEQVEAFSAGSAPTTVDPDTITELHVLGIDPTPLQAKSLALFAGQSFDYIITVCDRVRESCPVFPGDPHQVHWSFADPAVIEDPNLRRQAFHTVALELQTRLRYLLLLPHPATGQRLRPWWPSQ